MAQSHTASQTIAEMREYAAFTPAEQFFIARSLDMARERGPVPCGAGVSAHCSVTWTQYMAYRDLRAQRDKLRKNGSDNALQCFFGALVDVSAQDFARGHITSFDAYRFLYERLLGSATRPYLPASFCAAAALPTIAPDMRRSLLGSVNENIITTPRWSSREPAFFPCKVAEEAA